MSILYEDLTWQEIQEKIQQGYMVVLPCGCIEQSGPHLPVDIDSWTITHRVREGAERATEKYGVKVLVLPTLYYRPGHEHMGFPGTIRLSFETHLRVVLRSSIVSSTTAPGRLSSGRVAADVTSCPRHWAKQMMAQHGDDIDSDYLHARCRTEGTDKALQEIRQELTSAESTDFL